MISTIFSGESLSILCVMTARSASKLMLKRTRPSRFWKPPSTADVQAPQVMPSMATVVVAMDDGTVSEPFGRLLDGSLTCVSTSVAPNPRSSIVSRIVSTEITVASCSMTALSDSRDTLKLLTPGTFVKPPSTADVHAPQVIPSIATVVVEIGVLFSSVSNKTLWLGDFCASGAMSVESTSASNPRSSIVS